MADKTYRVHFTLSDGSTKSVQFTAPQGDKGDSPIKGKDYFTEADKAELISDVVEDVVSKTGVKSVIDVGARGDGTTDDTAAFQTALAENRVVFVPGGTYKLSNTLTIGAN